LDHKRLHIVSFTVPFPADYGGVIDVFHKIRHLHALGWKIDLHCFTYDRPPSSELIRYTNNIHYYPRRKSPFLFFSKLPYIVISRNNEQLLDALRNDTIPVLFEGLHCTYPLLRSPGIGSRSVVRTHNIEHDYYRMLADADTSILKSAFFRKEAAKLKRYEPILSKCHSLAAISQCDQLHFKSLNNKSELVFPFHAFDTVSIPSGCGTYSLFHGALHVADNHRAAMWLLNEVAPKLGHDLIIAGKGIQDSLRKKSETMKHVRLVENPSHDEMNDLISGAQSHLLPAFAQAGVKLKLLHALFHGRHVITNSTMLKGTQLHPWCILAETAEDFVREASSCHNTALDTKFREHRQSLEQSPYSNHTNAMRLSEMLDSARRG